MNNSILMLISLLVFTGCEQDKLITSIDDRSGIKYEVNSTVGYTGKNINWFQLATEQDPDWTGEVSQYKFSKPESGDPTLYKKLNKFLSTIYRNGNLENGCYKIYADGKYCVGIAKVAKANDLIYIVTSGRGYDEQWKHESCHACSGTIKYSILQESGDTFEIYADSDFQESGDWGEPPDTEFVKLNKKGDIAWFYKWHYTGAGGDYEEGFELKGLVSGEIKEIASWVTGIGNTGRCGGSAEKWDCDRYSQAASVSAILKGDTDFYPLHVVVNNYKISKGVKTEERKQFLVEYSKYKKSYVLPAEASELLER
ncbi:MAG: hypothetical protein P8Q17_06200 [Methylophilaceae bacterium]|nr:hypothetical protein [Methylophilaceae bacterium]